LRTALRTLAGLVRFDRLRRGEREVELKGFVLGVPAPGAFDAHPDDYRDVIVHAGKHAASATVCVSQNFYRFRADIRDTLDGATT